MDDHIYVASVHMYLSRKDDREGGVDTQSQTEAWMMDADGGVSNDGQAQDVLLPDCFTPSPHSL